jgi:methanogenic corrinoid protein MtbC1
MQADLGRERAELLAILETGDASAGVDWAQRALAGGTQPLDLFEGCISPVLDEIGERFQRLDIFLPELLQSAEVIQAIMDRQITPALRASHEKRAAQGKVVIGTVKGDMHDIGKNMVVLMLELNGFDVTDLGTDVAAADFIELAQKGTCDIIAMSAILTTSLPHMGNVMELLKGFGLRDQFKVVIGGAATSQAYAEKIGADGYGRDAASAVELCRRLCAVSQAARA